jgi:glycine/serine hydroxymethyltransferase
MREGEMVKIAEAVDLVLSHKGSSEKVEAGKKIVRELCESFPLYA